MSEDAGADEPIRYLPDGRPMATKRKKKRPESDSPIEPLAKVRIDLGERLIVAGDLRLGRQAPESPSEPSIELARVLEALQGTCTLVISGNLLEPDEEGRIDAAAILTAHPRLVDAIKALSGRPGCAVVVCPGERDHALSTDAAARVEVGRRLGAKVAILVEVDTVSGTGSGRVIVDPSGKSPHRTDARPASVGLSAGGLSDGDRTPWLEGIEHLSSSADLGAFTSSRLFYRRILRRFSWTVIPFLVAMPLLVLARATRSDGDRPGGRALDAWSAYFAFGGLALIGFAVVVSMLWWLLLRKEVDRGVKSVVTGEGDEYPGQVGFDAERWDEHALVGMVGASTSDAELTREGTMFVADSGCSRPVATRRPGRMGAPDAWTVEQRWSWLEIESGSTLHARLHLARRQLPMTTFLERVFTRQSVGNDAETRVVARWPSGPDWPGLAPVDTSRRRARRSAALLIAAAGLINLMSAVLPPLRDRIVAVRHVVPLAVSQTAAVVVTLTGLLLLLLARGIRRGQRHAWIVAEATLMLSVVLHVVKGLDLEEAIVAVVVALYLAAKREHFRVRADDVPIGRGLMVLVVGAVTAVATAVAAIKLVPGHRHPHLSWTKAVQAAVERLVGVTTVPLGHHLDRFLVPVMVAVTFGLVIYAGWLIFSPVVAHRLGEPEAGDEARARQIIETASGGTLAYFALRDDKRWFFWGHSLIAYAIIQGVALVSPDPIGPVSERRRVWAAFRRYADERGWPVTVMGATDEWLAIYEASGMRSLYIGDEAVVDVQRFTLDGPRNKAVRQAVNRVANKGYSIEFCDPAALEADLEAQLRSLMTESRRGEMERGFSMTLGRVFDPRDTGLLLAVCRDGDGVPAAFCQYVPAPGIGGYSLDLMRRSEQGEHPNGLTDFVVAETILYLQRQGASGLGLNFATMRSILSGERGDDTTRRVQRWFYQKMSDSMQIESLWRYNAKFDPRWAPRYACYEATEHLLSSATALAKAESWWEIPVVGRFFRPSEPADRDEPRAEAVPAVVSAVGDEPPVHSGESSYD